MMKKIIVLMLAFVPAVLFGQAIVKGSGVVYTNGVPTHSVNLNTDAELAIDTTSGYWYERSRDGLGWLAAGFRIQKLAGSSPPSGAPGDKESEVQLNDVDSLYRWRAGAWQHINKVLVYTAGTGISVTGTVIANTGDLLTTNEGSLTVGAGTGTTSLINSNTSGSTAVTLQASGIIGLSESGNTITISATEIDGSTSNELQTFGHSGTTSYTNTLSNGGGSFTLQSSGIVTISNSSGTVTIGATEVDGSTSNELQTYAHSGTTTYTNTLSNGGGSFSITGAGINVVSQTAGAVTITATEVDGSTTNELQTLANTSNATTHTATLSNSGGSIQLVEGTGITLTTTGTSLDGIVTIAATAAGTDLTYSGTSSPVTLNSSSGTDVTITAGGIVSLSATSGNITISATEVDGSTTNELQTISNTSDATSHTVTLSNSGGSLQLVEGSNITLTTTGTSGAGIVTIAATGGGTTDLAFTGSSSPVTLNSSTGTDVTFTAGGINTMSATSGNITITATEVDGSITNEGSLTVAAGGANDSQISSNTSGSSAVVISGGANVTVTESGNTITIAATSGGGSDLTFSGTSSPVTLNSSSGTDVTLTAGGIVSMSATSGNITISATEVDGSTSNELQTYAHSGTTTYTNTLSNGGGSFSITGAGINVVSQTAGAVTITATEVDGSVTNELQTIANTSDATSHTVTLSNSGGSIQMVEGSGITLTTTGTSGAGIVTIAATAAGTDLTYSGASSPVTLNSSSGTDVTITAGGIVTLSATSGNITISATEVDGSTSNELQTYSHSGTTTYTNTLSNGGGSFSITGAGINVVSQTAGAVTITATEVDGSVTNELQTIANTSDATSHTVTLSNSGGSVQLVEGSGITLTTTGTSGAGIVTIASTATGNTDLTYSGTSSPVTLNSSTGTDVTITAGGIVTLSATSGNITISATEVDGSTSNELQTYAHSGTTTYTNTLSNGGGSFSITGAGINVVSQTAGAVTITATEVDGSVTNELQTIANTSNATSHTVTLSNSGGSIQMVEGTGITLTTTGTSGAGILTIAATAAGTDLTFSGASSPVTLNSSSGTDVTITAGGIVSLSATSGNITISATEVDGSVTNEAWTIDGDDADTEVISNQTVKFQGAGITTTDYNPATDVLLITSTEVDGSTSNELQTFGHSGTTSYTNTLSNGGGSFTLQSSGIVTISNSSGTVTIGATEVDGSTSNELQTYAHSGTTTYTNTLSNGGGSFSITGAGINVVSQTAGAVTITATEVDGSVTNELQTIANTSDATSHTVTLSNSGGSVQLVEGSNITLTTTGTSGAGIVTIASTGGGTTDLTFSGSSSPVTLNSSTGTDVTLTAGGINTMSATSGNITITATEVDGSTTNELQTIANTSDATSHTVTLSNSGGSVQLVEGSGITLTTTGTSGAGIVTIASTGGTPTAYSIIRGYVEGQTGTTIDLDANDGKTKDVDGTNLLFDVPTNLENFRVYKNGVELNKTGTGTTRDYSADASANSITLTTALLSTDRLIVQSVTGSALDLYTSGELTGAGTSASPVKLAQNSATTGQMLAWNGSSWAPTNVSVSPSIITPSQITSDQDNYNPTGFDAATIVRLSSDAFRAITSMVSQSDGEEKTFVNVGSFPIYFPGQHPDGTAANRIITPYDYFLFPGKSVKMYYDNTASRWYITGSKDPAQKGIFYNTSFGSITAGDWGFIALNVSGTAAGQSATAATSSVPGAMSLTTGTTSTGASSVSFSKTLTNPIYFSGSHIAAYGTVSVPTLSDGTQTYSCGLQVTASPTSSTFAPNNTVGIRYSSGTNSGKWQGFSKDNSGTESTVDLGVIVAANTPYLLRIEIDKQNSEARFYLDGVMAGRVNSNMPTANTAGVREVIVKSAGTTASTFNAHHMAVEGIY